MSKVSLKVYGFDDLIKKINKSESQIKKIIEEANKKSMKPTYDYMLDFIKHHHLTGLTESTLLETEPYWEGTKCKSEVGFDLNKGGIAALMLDLGRPKGRKPTFFIHYSVNKTWKERQKILSEAMREILEELK